MAEDDLSLSQMREFLGLPAHRFQGDSPGAEADTPHHPPNYRDATTREERCSKCEFDTNGHCRKYDEYPVEPDKVCDSFMAPAPPIPSGLTEEGRGGKGKKPKVITFDFDETITKAPKQLSHIARALKACGDEIVVVTGNQSPAEDLEDRLAEYDFPFDQLIQYQDDETDGLQRRGVLKELNAYLAFDDRAGRAPTLSKACPHLFLAARPTKANKKAAKDAKSPKKIVKDS